MKYRLYRLLLASDTIYTEFLMGLISLLIGIWLFSSSMNDHFVRWYGIPATWGILLTVSGIFKIIGVVYEVIQLRIMSCMVAFIVWILLFISCWQYNRDQSLYFIPFAVLTFVLACFNAFIYVKLRAVVSKNK